MAWDEKKTQAVIMLLVMTGIFAFIYYWRVGSVDKTGEYNVRVGNYRLTDGVYDQALSEFEKALEFNPENVNAHFGMAIAYMQQEDSAAAFEWYAKTLSMDSEYAPAYANRGMLNDRLGRYEEALEDYKQALRLDPDIAKGPGKLWRFMRNIKEKPSSIYDRAVYIQKQLKLPPEKRLLRVVSEDEKQRMYKYKKK
ncbi:MAG: tetratricopeptide repeat protein [Thermodesulfovibrionales bacterium]|nr:tetratricopeptide repeat protein [Thermodesulfovibrionales bacterium]